MRLKYQVRLTPKYPKKNTMFLAFGGYSTVINGEEFKIRVVDDGIEFMALHRGLHIDLTDVFKDVESWIVTSSKKGKLK